MIIFAEKKCFINNQFNVRIVQGQIYKKTESVQMEPNVIFVNRAGNNSG